MRILVADDDPQMLRAVRITLSARGYDVVTAVDGTSALEAAITTHPDLVVIDVGMPGLNGIEVIAALRGWNPVPVLVVSGRSEPWEKVEALDAGADDYVTKPFSADELLARIRALLRRIGTTSAEAAVSFGDIVFDPVAHTVTRSGRAVHLTPTEWRLLEVLVRNHDKLVTREALLAEAWGPQYTTDTGYLRLYIAQLRKKLEVEPSNPRHVLTEAGMGYRFVSVPTG